MAVLRLAQQGVFDSTWLELSTIIYTQQLKVTLGELFSHRVSITFVSFWKNAHFSAAVNWRRVALGTTSGSVFGAEPGRERLNGEGLWTALGVSPRPRH